MAASPADTQEDERRTLSTLLAGIDGIEPDATASALIARFGSLMDTMAAPRRQLSRVTQGRHEPFDRIQAAYQLIEMAQRGAVMKRPLLNSHAALIAYVRLKQGYRTTESLRLLHLNARLYLAGEDVLPRGGPDYVDVDLRDLVHRVLDEGSPFLILAHNHPSGDANPSNADKSMTNRIAAALHPVGVRLVEHLIVARENWFSFRQAGLL